MTIILMMLGFIFSSALCALVAIGWEPPLPSGSEAAPARTRNRLFERVRGQRRAALFVFAAAVLMALAIGWLRGMKIDGLSLAVSAHVFLALSVIDLRTGWLPDLQAQSLLWLALLVQLVWPLTTIEL